MAGNANARDGVALARQAYLFGVGNDGVPLRDRQRLLELSTVHSDTLARHIARWEKEAEEIARSAGQNALGFCLREDAMAAHAADVDFLRREMDRTKDEVDNVDEIQWKLDTLLERIGDSCEFGPEHIDSVSRLLESYFKHSLNRKSLLSLFLSLEKQWMESSAIRGTISAYETSLKEQAKRRAKQEFPTPASSSPPAGALAATSNTTVFQRG